MKQKCLDAHRQSLELAAAGRRGYRMWGPVTCQSGPQGKVRMNWRNLMIRYKGSADVVFFHVVVENFSCMVPCVIGPSGAAAQK